MFISSHCATRNATQWNPLTEHEVNSSVINELIDTMVIYGECVLPVIYKYHFKVKCDFVTLNHLYRSPVFKVQAVLLCEQLSYQR